MKKRYYTDLDDISVYNWYKLNETNDYKWLCRPNQRPDAAAVAVYQDLLYQFSSLNLDTLKERKDMVVQAISIVEKIIDEKDLDFRVLNGVSLLLRAFMIKPESANLDILRKLLNSNDIKFRLSLLERDKRIYESTIKEQKTPQNIFEKCAVISTALNGLAIDPKKISVSQFIAYEKTAIEQQKYKTDGTR